MFHLVSVAVCTNTQLVEVYSNHLDDLISAYVVFVCVVSVFLFPVPAHRTTFSVDPDTHIDSIEQAEEMTIEGTSKWSCKIAITGIAGCILSGRRANNIHAECLILTYYYRCCLNILFHCVHWNAFLYI